MLATVNPPDPAPPSRLVSLPAAILERVVPISYAQIGQLLYGQNDLNVIKRISGWRRTDPKFPAAVATGRSPAFDAKAVWKWLEDRQRSADGRTRDSLSAMTELFSADPAATSRRNLLLAVQALRADLGDDRVRRFVMGLAALRRMAEDPDLLRGVEVPRWMLPAAQAKRLVDLAATAATGANGFAAAVSKALPAWSWLNADAVSPELLALTVQSLRGFPLTDLAASVEGALDSEDVSASPHLTATSTSGHAAKLVGLIAQNLTQINTTQINSTQINSTRPARVTRTVYDPAIGEGRLLSMLGRDRSIAWKMSGQDCDLEAVDMATARLIAAGCEVDLRVTPDSLHEDQFAGQTFDLVVADPPLPPTGSGRSRRRLPEMGPWWQHISEKLAGPTARAVILSTDQPGSQPPDEWLTSGQLLAVVETGERMRRDVPGLTVLWVLKGPEVNGDSDGGGVPRVICIAPDPTAPMDPQLAEPDSRLQMLAEITTDLLTKNDSHDESVDHHLAQRVGVRIRFVDSGDTASIRPTGQRVADAGRPDRLAILQTEVAALLADVSEPERQRWMEGLAEMTGSSPQSRH